MATSSDDIEAILQENIKSTSASSSAPSTLSPNMFAGPVHKTRTAALLLFVIIVAAISSIFLFFASRNTQTTLPASIPTSSPSPSINPSANWKTYTNSEYRYSVEFPTDWEAIEAKSQDTLDWPYDRLGEDQLHQVRFSEKNPGQWQGSFTLSVDKNPKNFDTESWKSTYFRPLVANPATNLAKLQGKTLIDNNIGYKFSVFSFDSNETVIGLVKYANIYTFIFTEENPNDPDVAKHSKIYQQILSSFRFLEDTTAINTQNWSVYTHPSLGFSIRYPKDRIAYKQSGESVRFSQIADINGYPTNDLQVLLRYGDNLEEALLSDVPVYKGSKEVPSTVPIEINNAKGIQTTSNFGPNNYLLHPSDKPTPILRIFFGHEDKEFEETYRTMFETFRFLDSAKTNVEKIQPYFREKLSSIPSGQTVEINVTFNQKPTESEKKQIEALMQVTDYSLGPVNFAEGVAKAQDIHTIATMSFVREIYEQGKSGI